MATVTLRDENRVLEDPTEISTFLAPFGIWYRRFEGSDQLPENATDPEILEAYREPIELLKAEGGYVTADVINVKPETPGLDAMLNRFNKEHWHDEDEVRFIVHGRGVFHIHPPEGPVFGIEMVKGDMIRVPRGTHHWFDLCSDKHDPGRAPVPGHLRLDAALHRDQGGSGFEPLCFGPAYMPAPGI